MIGDLEEILGVINTTNRLFYKGIVPPERFKDPFMSYEELMSACLKAGLSG